jgi:hypothetical protein
MNVFVETACGIAATAMVSFLACGGRHRPAVTAHLPPFTVNVRLSKGAAARLEGAGETVVVVAYFFGFPIPSARELGGEMGELHVGHDEREMKGAGIAEFKGSEYDSSRLAVLEKGEVKVLINVVSGRRSDKNNLLDCDVFEDSVARAAREGIPILCKLIGE